MSGCGCDDRRWRRMLDRRHVLVGGGAALAFALAGSRGSASAQEATPAASERIQIRGSPVGPLPNGTFVSPLVELYGNVTFGAGCFIAGNTILYASEDRLISLGDANNCQDNVYPIANDTDLTFGGIVSIAHQAALENSVIGDFTFFGFRSRVRSSTIGEGTMVMHNTIVEGVTLPPNRITPSGATITTQADADALPELTGANDEFKRDVQDVNAAFATGYAELYASQGLAAVVGVSPNPVTFFNPDSVLPQIGDGVRLGNGSRVGQRTAIRADAGTPIVIGQNARIGSRVTFHALLETSVSVGDNATIGDGCVLHGPLSVGNNLTCEDDCVLFRAVAEDNVIFREGTIVPERAVIETQEQADALPTR